MAVWKGTVAGFPVVIHRVDHLPPHCHVFIRERNVRVGLETIERLNGSGPRLPPLLGRGLLELRDELLEAWSRVEIIGAGKDE